uniref:Uncharacterized protein n=1 Tax=Timema genevievae TaxID=629358 RepID=A0A7R9K280_TIMGE|nr:unnamed protein product [Timema genevievae]
MCIPMYAVWPTQKEPDKTKASECSIQSLVRISLAHLKENQTKPHTLSVPGSVPKEIRPTPRFRAFLTMSSLHRFVLSQGKSDITIDTERSRPGMDCNGLAHTIKKQIKPQIQSVPDKGMKNFTYEVEDQRLALH